MNDAERWDLRYAQPTGEIVACRVLREHLHLLPAGGEALDLACGRGANAIALARAGLRVVAWDISTVAISALAKHAAEQSLDIRAECRDVAEQPPDADCFDVIVSSHFLVRKIIPALKDALRANGLIFYQTFVKERVSEHGPQRDDYRLDRNELLGWFSDCRLLFYREEGRVGDIRRGTRDEAMLIASVTRV